MERPRRNALRRGDRKEKSGSALLSPFQALEGRQMKSFFGLKRPRGARLGAGAGQGCLLPHGKRSVFRLRVLKQRSYINSYDSSRSSNSFHIKFVFFFRLYS